MSSVVVSTGGRLHFGFLNLSLAHERLYGGIGLALATPQTQLVCHRASRISIDGTPDSGAIREYAKRSCELLGVEGVSIQLKEQLPAHQGLGSGTQLALSVLQGVASVYSRSPSLRALAPELGRGGRSGIGVATFERGGFTIDAGHPTSRFTTSRPSDGEWTVPAITVHHQIPSSWRFVLVIPQAEPGRSGEAEEQSMRDVIEHADAEIANKIAGVVSRRLLPAIADSNLERFGSAITEIGRLNGTWYTNEQGGVYRPPAGEVISHLQDSAACFGTGQSSWGPTVYTITNSEHLQTTKEAAREAVQLSGTDATILTVSGRNAGARVDSR